MANHFHTPPPRPGQPIFQEYPKQLNKPGYPFVIVSNEDEEDKAIARGYSEEGPVSTVTAPSSPMTTLPAATDAYDKLKKNYEDAVKGFNEKWNTLRFETDELKAKYKTATDGLYDAKKENRDLAAENARLSKKLDEKTQEAAAAVKSAEEANKLAEAATAPKAPAAGSVASTQTTPRS